MTAEKFHEEVLVLIEKARESKIPLHVVLGLLEIAKLAASPVVLKEEES